MTLANVLFHVFGFTTRWTLHAQGFSMALLAPVLVIAIADRHVRSRR